MMDSSDNKIDHSYWHERQYRWTENSFNSQVDCPEATIENTKWPDRLSKLPYRQCRQPNTLYRLADKHSENSTTHISYQMNNIETRTSPNNQLLQPTNSCSAGTGIFMNSYRSCKCWVKLTTNTFFDNVTTVIF